MRIFADFLIGLAHAMLAPLPAARHVPPIAQRAIIEVAMDVLDLSKEIEAMTIDEWQEFKRYVETLDETAPRGADPNQEKGE